MSLINICIFQGRVDEGKKKRERVEMRWMDGMSGVRWSSVWGWDWMVWEGWLESEVYLEGLRITSDKD